MDISLYCGLFSFTLIANHCECKHIDYCLRLFMFQYYRDLKHLSREEVEKNNFDHPDSLETELLVEHLKYLKNRIAIEIPTYDFSTHSR